MFRFNGQPAIGLAIAMRKGGNLLNFGGELKAKMREVEATLPIGVGVHLVSDQPRVVEKAVGGFTEALVEAIAIVLLVSFLSLGVRAGLVVSVSIPLVLAVTFVVLDIWGISLQRISLGALIIALGLLVDDAMITVEMMVARLEAGDTKTRRGDLRLHLDRLSDADGHARHRRGLSADRLQRQRGRRIHLQPVRRHCRRAIDFVDRCRAVRAARRRRHAAGDHETAWRQAEPFFDAVPRAPAATLSWRWLTIGTTVAALALSVFRLALRAATVFSIVRPTGNSGRHDIAADELDRRNAAARWTRFEERLKDDPDIEQWSSYVGQGAIRFYLPLDQQLENAFFGQFVIQAKSLEARNRVIPKLQQFGREQFVGIDVFVHTLDLGPPVGRPIQYRLSGPDLQSVRERALSLAGVVSANPHVAPPTFDWNEPGEVLRVEILQDKARALGITSQDIANFLNGVVGGATITQVRDSIYLVNVVARAQAMDRNSPDTLRTLQIGLANGRIVPLLAFARLKLRHRAADRLAPRPAADHHRARHHPRRRPSRRQSSSS